MLASKPGRGFAKISFQLHYVIPFPKNQDLSMIKMDEKDSDRRNDRAQLVFRRL